LKLTTHKLSPFHRQTSSIDGGLPCPNDFSSVVQLSHAMRRRHLLRSEPDIWSIANQEEIPVRRGCTSLMIYFGLVHKVALHGDLLVTIDQMRDLVTDCRDHIGNGGPDLNLISTRKRLIGQACAWLRYLGHLREPDEQIPFGSLLNEYCDWAKRERGLTDNGVHQFRRTIRMNRRTRPVAMLRSVSAARRRNRNGFEAPPYLVLAGRRRPGWRSVPRVHWRTDLVSRHPGGYGHGQPLL
jgi:hypothetical protein